MNSMEMLDALESEENVVDLDNQDDMIFLVTDGCGQWIIGF